MDHWRSPPPGIVYQSRWRVTIPAERLVLEIEPHPAATARRFLAVLGMTVKVTRHAARQAIAGNGYVESGASNNHVHLFRARRAAFRHRPRGSITRTYYDALGRRTQLNRLTAQQPVRLRRRQSTDSDRAHRRLHHQLRLPSRRRDVSINSPATCELELPVRHAEPPDPGEPRRGCFELRLRLRRQSAEQQPATRQRTG